MVGQLTPVPNAPPFVDGVTSVRGRVIPAVSLRARFGFERVPHDLRTRLVVVRAGGRVVGLIVDNAREFAAIPATSIQPPPDGHGRAEHALSARHGAPRRAPRARARRRRAAARDGRAGSSSRGYRLLTGDRFTLPRISSMRLPFAKPNGVADGRAAIRTDAGRLMRNRQRASPTNCAAITQSSATQVAAIDSAIADRDGGHRLARARRRSRPSRSRRRAKSSRRR